MKNFLSIKIPRVSLGYVSIKFRPFLFVFQVFPEFQDGYVCLNRISQNRAKIAKAVGIMGYGGGQFRKEGEQCFGHAGRQRGFCGS
jgi:hypothetical protein